MNILEALVQTRNSIQGWVVSNLSNKVDKVAGKGLSTEDFTTEEKEKLASLSNNTPELDENGVLYFGRKGE